MKGEMADKVISLFRLWEWSWEGGVGEEVDAGNVTHRSSDVPQISVDNFVELW